ncbi:MAG: signal recognition particle subunit SRP19/SEC65 family protein [Candidatus Thorarchaeota archaeon]|nr:signal recognition particle subunit SRP19/SEC65 family protein [Candidatus Thorarchaeota archaeon]
MKPHKDKVIVWPAYLDSGLSRSQGRRIPVNLAAPGVTIDILKQAADSIGFEAIVEPDKRYPRDWTRSSGYLLLGNPDHHKKKRLLLMLAKSVRRIVAQREAARIAAEKKKGKKRKGKGGRR